MGHSSLYGTSPLPVQICVLFSTKIFVQYILLLFVTKYFHVFKVVLSAFSALTLLVGWQKGHLACKKTEWWDVGMVVCDEVQTCI